MALSGAGGNEWGQHQMNLKEQSFHISFLQLIRISPLGIALKSMGRRTLHEVRRLPSSYATVHRSSGEQNLRMSHHKLHVNHGGRQSTGSSIFLDPAPSLLFRCSHCEYEHWASLLTRIAAAQPGMPPNASLDLLLLLLQPSKAPPDGSFSNVELQDFQFDFKGSWITCNLNQKSCDTWNLHCWLYE